MESECEVFRYNAEESLKLLNRGFRIVLTQDGLGHITALAIPRETGLEAGVKAWIEFDPDLGMKETIEDMQRKVFEGPNKFSGCGHTVAEALHVLTEKAVFNRLPDGSGGYYSPPESD